ncbi:MAG: carbon starvation protein A [Planctomycetes bacterium]|nr:carbon starvation protein A [Planctomycetota bacterium]MBL7043419.1 carbon starvation protein A [Pirellulaceae bacterium]
MSTLLVAIGAFVGYLVAYHTYGRWLARKIFRLDPKAVVPSIECRDDIDYCPTRKQVIFGHHYTSIAGTGPIVGPAIAVFWGWLPALLWVIFGAIFIGAVHDFGALVVSLRNRGQTVGDVAGRMIAPRVKYLFLTILFFALTLVLAVFGLVIATIFRLYPESVLSVWFAMPVAIAMGLWVHKFNGKLLIPSLMALGLMYAAIYLGVYHFPFPNEWLAQFGNPIVIWTIILLAYCYIASVLPVWLLLQPRDYVNSHQLIVALALLVVGVAVAGVTNQADINSAPAIVPADELPQGAPPILPFLFITIACGAISGFHCLVSSGTTSKQLAKEPDAHYVGYGSMLMEGVLAVLVILACCAGVGMGKYVKTPDPGSATVSRYVAETKVVDGIEQQLKGRAAWRTRYDNSKPWKDFGLGTKLAAFIEGGANFLGVLGIPLELAIGIIAVLVASFAATTLDTATRLHRYVIQELAGAIRLAPMTNKFAATGLAVVLGGVIAVIPAPGKDMGTGGLILWPLFGATNQLLAGLAFLVTFFYLWRRGRPAWFIAIPMTMMLVMPLWALLWQMFYPETGWAFTGQYMLFGIGIATMALQVWMVVEALLMIPRAKGVLEEALPPFEPRSAMAASGGRSC